MYKLKGENLISYCILNQILLEVLDSIVFNNPEIFDVKLNKKIIKDFIECIERKNKPLYNSLFSISKEKSSLTNRNIENLLSIVIIDNVNFNRKFLRIKNDTDKSIIPKTDEFQITNDKKILFDKFDLLIELILEYHNKWLTKTFYKNVSLKNHILKINSLFEKNKPITNKSFNKNHYDNFKLFFNESDINKQLLFYENLLYHLNIDYNC